MEPILFVMLADPEADEKNNTNDVFEYDHHAIVGIGFGRSLPACAKL